MAKTITNEQNRKISKYVKENKIQNMNYHVWSEVWTPVE